MALRKYMTDEEILLFLSEYDDIGFDDLPDWMRLELTARNIPIPTREPTEMEQWDTVQDAREHRIMNKELSIQDYKDKYVKGKSLTLIM